MDLREETTNELRTTPPTIKIKYKDSNMPKLTFVQGKSNWIDLMSATDVNLFETGHFLIDLGVSMQLPAGYEAIIAPRSSSFKNWGVIQTNSIGVVDETYCGDNDVWMWSVYGTRKATIKKYDRICQFRIQKIMGEVNFEEVESLGNKDRGGIGSTGK